MDALVTTLSSPAVALSQSVAQSQSHHQHQHQHQQLQLQGPRHQTISVCSPSSDATVSPHKEAAAGATVFVAGGSVPDLPGVVPEVAPPVIASAAPGNHVVKIQINPDSGGAGGVAPRLYSAVRINLDDDLEDAKSVIVYTNGPANGCGDDRDDGSLHRAKVISVTEHEPCVRISVRGGDYSGSESSSEELHQVGAKDMVQQRSVPGESSNSASRASSSCFYYSSPLSAMVMSSGQCSPSETLDSGTCSDLDGTPPPLPKKKTTPVVVGVTAAAKAGHDRTGSLTSSGAEVDSDDNESIISCDSLNGAELPLGAAISSHAAKFRTPRSVKLRSAAKHRKPEPENEDGRAAKDSPVAPLISERTYEERHRESAGQQQQQPEAPATGTKYLYEDDRFYKFHVNERDEVGDGSGLLEKNNNNNNNNNEDDDESFAGYKILEREAIRSAKGTVRGVKNRVRAGIATFLQKPSTKNYKAKDAGKVVVYTTTMGIVRETYYRCVLVKQILRTHMVKYEERDMYMSTESQTELRDRIGCTAIQVPQLFIDGQYIGDADAVERLNENGELRQMLKPYKSLDACSTCQACGGYRLLPCPVCNGSKKSVHRNDFTAEFVALKCMNCDEVGLVRCQHC